MKFRMVSPNIFRSSESYNDINEVEGNITIFTGEEGLGINILFIFPLG